MDLTRWLKDELGLIHMSEIDLNTLMYHPRHGSLCRRLVKFLADSTLCHKRYPNVNASEKYTESKKELESTNENLIRVMKELDATAKEYENKERDLIFLKAKMEHLRMLEEVQTASMSTLKELENRNNLGIEMMAQRIEEVDYLSNASLDALYTLPEPKRVISTMVTRQMTTIDEELGDTLSRVDKMLLDINNVLAVIDEKLDHTVQLEPKLRKTSMSNLVALKMPEFIEVHVDRDEDERKLFEDNLDLSKKVLQAHDEVNRLKDLHRTKLVDMNREYKNELNKCIGILRDMNALNESQRSGA